MFNGGRVVPREQMDGWTDMTKPVVGFRNFVNAHNKKATVQRTKYSYPVCVSYKGHLPAIFLTINH